jgi:hypothetical protein
MTQYLLSVHHDYETFAENMPAPEEMERMFKAVDEYNQEVQQAGAWVFGGGLHEPATATVVKAHEGGEPVVTDGPYAETKEALTGFYLIEAEDLDEAIRIASELPAAWGGAVELRPVIRRWADRQS